MLNDLIPEKNQQYPVFAPAVYDENAQRSMRILDAINQRFSPETLRFEREPSQRWNELFKVN